ncbi:MAG: hypothetical protein NUW22_01150 [Acidobacteria bacterium]|nr:hypothetical protein [Acidobacteriota bacterium]
MKTYADTLDEQARASAMVLEWTFADHWDGAVMRGRWLAQQMLEADSYFCAPDFSTLVAQAAQLLPTGTGPDREDFPGEHGWVTLGRSTLLDRAATNDDLTYSTVVHVEGFYWRAWPDHWSALTFSDTQPLGWITFAYGDAPNAAAGGDLAPNEDDIARWVRALWLLTSQRSVTEQSQETPPRAFGKRAERAGIVPLIRVIRLPRRVREQGAAELGHVDWHHRWIVSGHWRQQPWGPERKRIRPVWIAPHVKGPDDKPLKLQAHRLFVAEGEETLG